MSPTPQQLSALATAMRLIDADPLVESEVAKFLQRRVRARVDGRLRAFAAEHLQPVQFGAGIGALVP